MDALSQYSRLFGLIGYPLSHSFSKRYFNEKFEREGIGGCHYELFPLESIRTLRNLLDDHPNLAGLNVTIPHKQAVIPLLDAIDEEAAAVGAVNTICRRNGTLTGFNTDVYGFEHSLLPFIATAGAGLRALVLGTGGAAKAVAYVLKKMDIPFQRVSRTAGEGVLSYGALDEAVLRAHRLIINTTPLGMAPMVDSFPSLPYQYIGAGHFLYDLVYNPERTAFMKKGHQRGAAVRNGLEMLHLQAEKAWSIWNS